MATHTSAKDRDNDQESRLAPATVASRFVESLEDLLESIEYSSPKFWKEIEASRRSGRVSSATVEKSLDL